MSDKKNPRTRKWLLTFEDPLEKGWTHEKIKEELEKLKLVYWCMSDETGGKTGTFHTHVFIYRSDAIRASTLQTRFPSVHRDMCNGTCEENRNYVFKVGKWERTDKEETNHKDSHEEWGEMPIERQGARNDLYDLYDMIKEGMTTYQILEENPQYIMQIDKIERVRQTILEDKYADVWRDVEVTYIWGVTGTGKTRGVMEEYGYRNVFRVTDYDHPFDGYKGQDVIVLDEFRSSLRLTEMLDYLDGYPVEMKARYSNKQACFHKVFIISNIDIRDQYPDKQREEPLSWDAFLRRIDKVKYYGSTEKIEMPLRDYLEWKPTSENPFEKEVLYGL